GTGRVAAVERDLEEAAEGGGARDGELVVLGAGVEPAELDGEARADAGGVVPLPRERAGASAGRGDAVVGHRGTRYVEDAGALNTPRRAVGERPVEVERPARDVEGPAVDQGEPCRAHDGGAGSGALDEEALVRAGVRGVEVGEVRVALE